MLDAIAVVSTVVLFVASMLYLQACERLKGQRS